VRKRSVVFASLITAVVTAGGSVPAFAADNPSAAPTTSSSADPFDEGNAVDPGSSVLNEGSTSSPEPETPTTDPTTSPTTSPTSSTRGSGTTDSLKPVICDNGDQWISSWKSTSASNVITHASGYIIPAGGSGKYTKSVEFQTQLSVSLSFSTESTISAKIVETGLEGKVGFNVASTGQMTTTKNTSVETSVTRSGTHIFFMGRRKATGSFVGGRCSDHGTRIDSVTGKMQSYAIPYEGAVWCGEKPSSGSFKFEAKKYCD